MESSWEGRARSALAFLVMVRVDIETGPGLVSGATGKKSLPASMPPAKRAIADIERMDLFMTIKEKGKIRWESKRLP
jgi:hypothetical protein